MNIDEWRNKGRFINVNGYAVFVVEEGEASKPNLLVLHGYPTSSFDYHMALPLLTKHFKVIVHDHLGFGFSEKPENYSYSLIDQANIALQLWQNLSIKSGYVLAHDYGTSVLTEIVAKWNFGFRPININGLILGNGSLLIDKVKLLFVQRLLMNKKMGPVVVKLGTERYFQYNMKNLWWDKSKYPKFEMSQIYKVGLSKEAKKVFPKLSLYNHERYKFFNRWINNGLYKTDLPLNIYWADKDPIAVIAMAHELKENIPASNLQILKDVGHYPMLEAPELWCNTVFKLLNLK